MSGPQVLVVGGGLAGVAAAAALRAAGCSVRVIEREAAPGGRARGSERDGFRLDAAPFLVSARERRLAALIADAGLAGRLLPLRPVTLAQLRAGRVEETPPAGRPLEVARVGGVRFREALRLRRLARIERRFRNLLDAERPERAVRLDDRSAADFVRLYFGATVWERWAEPLLASDLLADPVDASRVCLLLARAARGAAPLATLRGSPASVAEALFGAADRLGSEVSAVTREGQGLALALRDGSRIEADAVVLALPARETGRVARELLAPAEHDGLGAARTAPAIVLSAALERSPTRKATRLRVPTLEALPLASVALEPGGAGAPAPPGAALLAAVATPAWSRAHLQAADGVVEKELLGAVGRIFPGVPGALRFCQLVRYEAAVPRFDVGRYRALARLRAVQADLRARGRRLYFAGDHWVAPTLEGAIASGLRAAAELCEDLGVRGSGAP
jgi:oxygen-dependent protoporphyrinogen oxidase